MFPTLSHLIEYISGVFIPLPFKTFGFFIAMAFLAGSWFIAKDLTEKNNAGIIPTTRKKVIVGKPTSIWDFLRRPLVGLIVGFKGLFAYNNYSYFIDDTFSFLFSLQGSGMGALLGLLLGSGVSVWIVTFEGVSIFQARVVNVLNREAQIRVTTLCTIR